MHCSFDRDYAMDLLTSPTAPVKDKEISLHESLSPTRLEHEQIMRMETLYPRYRIPAEDILLYRGVANL
jgi:hypothetical protein